MTFAYQPATKTALEAIPQSRPQAMCALRVSP